MEENLAHAISGALGGVAAVTLCYPLDNIRCRLQVGRREDRGAENNGPQQQKQVRDNFDRDSQNIDTTSQECSPLSSSTISSNLSSPLSSPSKDRQSPHPCCLHSPPQSPVKKERESNSNLTQQQITQIKHALSKSSLGKESSSSTSPPSASRNRTMRTKSIQENFGSMIESLFVDPVLMTKNIIKNEGWESLYNGLLSAQVGIGYSSAVYFFLFNYFKVHAVSLKSQRRMQTLAASTAAKKVSLGPIENLLVASIAGFINVFCTMPVWVVNTQMASAKKGEFASTWDCVKNIYGKHNMRGFYKGLIPALILVSNPAIQFMSYEHMMHLLLKRTSLRSSKQLSALQLFMMGALAKALATLATYPYQVLKSRLQSQHHNYDSTLAAVLSMWKDEGPGSFFEGMSAKMFQTVLNSAFLFLFKERLFFIVRYLLRLRRKRLA